MTKKKKRVISLKDLTPVGSGAAVCPQCGKKGFRAYHDKDGKTLMVCQYCRSVYQARKV